MGKKESQKERKKERKGMCAREGQRDQLEAILSKSHINLQNRKSNYEQIPILNQLTLTEINQKNTHTKNNHK